MLRNLDVRYQLALTCSRMKDVFILLIHLLTTAAKLLGPGGAKAIIAENLLLKQQLLVAFPPTGAHRQSRCRYSALDVAEISPIPGAPQIPSAVRSKEKNEAGS